MSKSSFAGSLSVSRDSTRTTSPSCTRPTPKGLKLLPVSSPMNGTTGGNPWVVQETSVPRCGSSTSDIAGLLQRGQRDCFGNVVAPHSSQVLPMSFGSSSGHVKTSAIGFCMGVTVVGNIYMLPPVETHLGFEAVD